MPVKLFELLVPIEIQIEIAVGIGIEHADIVIVVDFDTVFDDFSPVKNHLN